MAPYELFHPDTELIGQVILDFKEAVDSEHFTSLFEQYNLTNLDPDQWYPAQPWVDVLNAIAESGNAMMDFVSLGMRQMELVDWPSEFDNMPLIDIFGKLDAIYRLNYRGTDIGYINVEALGPNHVQITVRSFEPDNLWYGNIYGLTRRFSPNKAGFIVFFDEDTPRREQGGDVTVIHVKWN